MQEKKNKLLALSLVVMTCAMVVFYFLTSSDTTPQVDTNIFKVDDLKTIDRVLLESKTAKNELSFDGTRWLVNQKYNADPRMIQVLFATLQQAEPKRPVAETLRDSIVSTLEREGVLVTLFSDGEEKKSFYAGGNGAKTQSYFSDSKSKEVYLMTIPGYRVYVPGIFEMEESGFRDKFVFAFNWRNFKSLKAEFPRKPQEGFLVAMDKDFFTIQGMNQVDTARLNTFLDQVSYLTVERYSGTGSQTDSLSEITPMMIITIEDIAARKYELMLFQPDETGIVEGRLGGEAVSFESARIKPILRPKSFFAKE
jgi:hypothetical protein